MTTYRIYAHKGHITAVCIGNEFINANGLEVASGESDDLPASLAELAPMGVGSPWPPEDQEVVATPAPAKKAATAKKTAPTKEPAA